MAIETYSYIDLSHSSSENQEYNIKIIRTYTHLEMLVHGGNTKTEEERKKETQEK